MSLTSAPATVPPSTTKAAVALALAQESQQWYAKARTVWRSKFAYSVAVSEDDPLYPEVHTWLLSISDKERHRALKVKSRDNRFYDSPESSDSDGYTPPKLKIQFDDKTDRTMVIDGHRVRISIERPDISGNSTNTPSLREGATIQFVCKTYEAQQAILAHLNRINEAGRKDRKPVLKMVNTWGEWRRRSDIPPRTLASVSLPQGQKERVAGDLKRFLDSEERYNRLATPWHRGYMLHGPPGTGKTSLVKALANEFCLDLWYVSLSDLKGESSLLSLVADVGPRSILLLEDIDTLRITRDGEEADTGAVSIGALLNALDGVSTPHGLVTFMTTNHFEKLDPRLVRAGRMDVVELLNYPSASVVDELFFHFFDYHLPWLVDCSRDFEVAPASITEIFKRNLDDPSAAEAELKSLLFN